MAGTITGDWHLELGYGTEGAGIWNWIKMGTRTPNLSPKHQIPAPRSYFQITAPASFPNPSPKYLPQLSDPSLQYPPPVLDPRSQFQIPAPVPAPGTHPHFQTLAPSSKFQTPVPMPAPVCQNFFPCQQRCRCLPVLEGKSGLVLN